MSDIRQLAVFCHKMSKAIHAGFDIERALILAQENETGALGEAIHRTYTNVCRGMQLNMAMRIDEAIYTPNLVDAIYVSEQTGHYEEAFSKMASRFDSHATTRSKIVHASIYPVVVLIVLIVAVFAVTAVFDHLIQAIVITTAVFFVIFILFFILYGGKELSRKNLFIGNAVIRIPIIGKLIMKSELADFADNMAIFYDCGTPIEKALQYSSKTIRNNMLRNKIKKASAYVRQGNPLSEALLQQQVFPPDLISSLRVGEKSGDVSHMLEYVAQYYRADIQNSIDMMFTLIR